MELPGSQSTLEFQLPKNLLQAFLKPRKFLFGMGC